MPRRTPLLALAGCLAPVALPAAPLPDSASRWNLRAEAVLDSPVPLLPGRAGGALGVGYRLGDQLQLFGDAGQRGGPGGGFTTLALGAEATFDLTPVSPFVELALAGQLARPGVRDQWVTRFGLGADVRLARAISAGVVVRTLSPSSDSTSYAVEGALRFVFHLGGS